MEEGKDAGRSAERAGTTGPFKVQIRNEEERIRPFSCRKLVIYDSGNTGFCATIYSKEPILCIFKY